ncbi:MAG TPA: ribbon-helix-helix protein, CopG family [Solirubrobacteraceae bacterium]|nr:ribbon-helix-helix protein, CopG family [Solirubrobacteraceae bacterium]
MLTRRTQVLLDEDRYERLREHARRSGGSVGGVIREAIDRLLDEDRPQRRQEALAAFLDAEPALVGSPDELKGEILGMYDRGDEPR